jgi:hypothetical protein|tara:strand:- start:900 stop:1100 length:201 start_codon:yes stop_codon:yes gene_type:complete
MLYKQYIKERSNMRKITLQRERENTFFVEYKLNGGIVTYNGNTSEIKKVLDEDIGKNKYILKYDNK